MAEAAIAHQMDIEAQLPVLEKTLSEAGAKEKELESYITALQAKRREMKEELRQLTASRNQAPQPTAGTVSSNSDLAGKVANAGSAFERIMEKNTGLSNVSGTAGATAKLAELEELARNNRIQERLAAIKSDDK